MQSDVRDAGLVQGNSSAVWVVEALQELDQRRFSAPTCTNQRYGLALVNVQIQFAKNLDVGPCRIRERHFGVVDVAIILKISLDLFVFNVTGSLDVYPDQLANVLGIPDQRRPIDKTHDLLGSRDALLEVGGVSNCGAHGPSTRYQRLRHPKSNNNNGINAQKANK